jgi:dihydrolipoamide dehydrogenase
MARFDYDLAIIGSGDAGSEAAFLANEAGLSVAIIEGDKWGGSSLNYSDIPMGALSYVSQLLHQTKKAAKLGLSSSTLRYNYPTVNNWKNFAMKRAGADDDSVYTEEKITCIKGQAHLLSAHEISVGEETIKAKNILIATGASILDTGIKIPQNLEYWLPENVPYILRPPKSVFVVGAGATGCEVAQYFAEMGCEVTIADLAVRVLPQEDEEVGQVLEEIFTKDNITVLTQSRVIAIEKSDSAKKIVFIRGGQEKSVKADEVVLCTGAAPNVDIGLENAKVKYDHEGIKVGPNMQTSTKNIYACGDVIGGHSCSTKAKIEARIAAAHIIGKSKDVVDYLGLMRTTKLYPEIAVVGLTEDDCIKADKKYKKVIRPLFCNASITSNYRSGFIKMICDKKGLFIGATVMAPNASLIAQELAMALRYSMTIREIYAVPHPENEWSMIVQNCCEDLMNA